ncbi:hypothetical protein BGZ46_010664 [Entomortierella lignicola]|nr:hypothetical protein BGZ46_010664 [Entomortierella lignicola]
MASVTLPNPPSRSDSISDEDEIMAHHDPIGHLMSPPLSQESLVSSELNIQHDHLQQQQPQQLQSIHPLDQSILPAPRKTLNWVNALPSHFDTAVSGHPRKRRRRTNREELDILEDAFAKNLLPDAATRQELGDRLGMSVRAVQIWFQNRRQTLRKKSISSGVHNPGSEEDMSRSDAESAHSNCRRSSGDSALSLSPTLNPTVTGGRLLKQESKSCSNLLSNSPPPSSTQPNSRLLLRAETCSSLPTVVSKLPSTVETSSLRSSSPADPSIKKDQLSDTTAIVPALVAVKKEVIEPSPSEALAAAAVAATIPTTTAAPMRIQDILDVKTADRHLCMLLEEAKKRSGQGATPVMGIWSDKSSKPVLNPPSVGVFPATTTFPTPQRTMSTPIIKSSSQQQQQLVRSISKIARKHHSMPEPTITNSLNGSSPYPRTVSLMEQVINRQQLHRPAPTNFKQSALSRAGKYSLDNICNKARRSPPPVVSSSSTLSAAQLARRLQYVVSTNLKRVQSESVIHDLQKANSGGRCGQTAMRARRLSFGKFLFDSDTEQEYRKERSNESGLIPQQRQRQSQDQRSTPKVYHQRSESKLTHQAQKRRAGSTSTSGVSSPVERGQSVEVDGDETDEEDFVAQNQRSLNRFGYSKSFPSTKPTISLSNSVDLKRHEQRHQHQHPYLQHQDQKQKQQDCDKNRGMQKMSKRSLKSTLSTLSLVTSSPTREYALELERSHSPLTSYPILERNRTWNNGVTSMSLDRQTSSPSSPTSPTSPTSPNTTTTSASSVSSILPSTETKDLNMDELECASVLAGLGWGR